MKISEILDMAAEYNGKNAMYIFALALTQTFVVSEWGLVFGACVVFAAYVSMGRHEREEDRLTYSNILLLTKEQFKSVVSGGEFVPDEGVKEEEISLVNRVKASPIILFCVGVAIVFAFISAYTIPFCNAIIVYINFWQMKKSGVKFQIHTGIVIMAIGFAIIATATSQLLYGIVPLAAVISEEE